MFYAIRLAICISLVSSIAWTDSIPPGDWPHYSRDTHGTRYSPLTQIDKSNIGKLKRAWTFRTGDIDMQGHVFECTPLAIGGTIYVITPFQRLIAIDGVSGKELWSFDSKFDRNNGAMPASRAVAYWSEGGQERIVLPVRDGRLISIDLKTHKPDPTFGNQGTVDLSKILPGGKRMFISSPPSIYKNLIIQGCGLPDGARTNIEHVPVAAVDIQTGKLVWTFNTIPQENDPPEGKDTWQGDSARKRGGGNVWSFTSIDEERGIVYLPVSTPHFDFFGGDRIGDNLFSDCVVALDAATGKRLWHYQTVHHDLWDYDLPAQPNLVDLTVDGKRIPAVAQVTKTGMAFIFNRVTGEPVFPIEELEVPASDVSGEMASTTQPFPVKPPPLSSQGMTEDDLSRLDKETHEFLLKKYRTLRSDGMYTPPSLEGSIEYPGFHGGCNWSGAAVTPDGMMYANTTEMACYIKLEKDPNAPWGYRHTGWNRFYDQNGYPGNAPPWGQLVKVDLNQGEIVWEVPLGEYDELTARGIPVTGQENFGGATVTASGLVFIASTKDEKIRAFDDETGKILFEHKLEAGGYAAPIGYLGKDGKQYIVICAGGGGKLETPKGDYVIGFTLE